MKITHFAKYEQGKPSGKLDTQLFPECSGTDEDRDVVKKTVQRKKHTEKTAARPKVMVGLDAIRRSGPKVNNQELDTAISSANFKYKNYKDMGFSDPESLFWADDQLVASIKQELISEGISEGTADLVSFSVVQTDPTRARQRPTQTDTPAAPETPPAAPSVEKTMASTTDQVKTADRFSKIEQEISSIFGVPGQEAPAPKKPDDKAQYSEQRAEKRKETFNMKAANLQKKSPSCEDCTLDGISK